MAVAADRLFRGALVLRAGPTAELPRGAIPELEAPHYGELGPRRIRDGSGVGGVGH